MRCINRTATSSSILVFNRAILPSTSSSCIISRTLFSSISSCNIINRLNNNFICKQQIRHITDLSWAAETLTKRGEKLDVAPPQPEIFITPETFTTNHSDHVKQLSDDILALNQVEVNQLWKLLQARLGVKNVLLGGGGGGAAAGAGQEGGGEKQAAKAVEAPKEKEAFDIKLGAVDAKAKIKIIKEVRAITGLGLKEAKELVEKAPCVIKPGVKKEEAEAFKKLLVDAGANVTLE